MFPTPHKEHIIPDENILLMEASYVYVYEAYGFSIKFVFRLGEPCSSFGTTGNFHGN